MKTASQEAERKN